MVYFIQAEAGGPIKIGYTSSKSPRNRLANLQTAHSEKLIVLATTNWHKEENLHERFKAIRLHGEWFKPTVTLLTWIQQNAVVTADGHRQFARARMWAQQE